MQHKDFGAGVTLAKLIMDYPKPVVDQAVLVTISSRIAESDSVKSREDFISDLHLAIKIGKQQFDTPERVENRAG